MKKTAIYSFCALYVVFELVTWLFYPPQTLLDALAAVTVPAIALWGVYWTNLKAGEGLIGLFRHIKTDAPDKPKDS